MKIGIFGNEYQKSDQIERILDILTKGNAEIFIQKEFHEYLSPQIDWNNKVNGILDCKDLDLDMALSVGGDGTFLKTVSSVQLKNIPILGINTGRLGFLADVSEDDMEQTLSEILAGQYTVEERSQLRLLVNGEDGDPQHYALNEIAVLKQDLASMINVDVFINDEHLTSYEADGLIIATPTGSTAYSLSVGGPIMTPNTSTLAITAIAPHSLNARPLVIEDDNVITMKVKSRSCCFLISLDGRSKMMSADGTILQVEKSAVPVRIVKRKGHTFYNTLKKKLKWGSDPRLG
ncbi:NAD kinase [Dysgonomonas macrotermitis]|uniref:NAD kinase n=1 Tax=Dysgonomonas macrotermitis TaxID=1346286 RepID=A0A1M4UH49_9BACT|nr:NAD kinase [Dysgonomonas macrotermitis]SHE55995.1 NAD+ kinase [Dysgonomonas macrotermitis]